MVDRPQRCIARRTAVRARKLLLAKRRDQHHVHILLLRPDPERYPQAYIRAALLAISIGDEQAARQVLDG